jgi:sugar lactone lactonase YvrE
MKQGRVLAVLLALAAAATPSTASADPGTISTAYGGLPAGPRLATAVALFEPWGLDVLPGGSVLLAEYGHGAVQLIDASGSMLQIAGNGSKWCPWIEGRESGDRAATQTELCHPSSVAHDPSGRYVYVTDTYNQRVRRIDLQTGDLVTVAGGGPTPPYSGYAWKQVQGVPATAAALQDPLGVAVDADGDLYISDSYAGRVVRVDHLTGIMTTFAGGVEVVSGMEVPAGAVNLRYPAGLAFDGSGALLIADRGHSRIVRVTPAGLATVVAGTGQAGFAGDGGPATAAKLNWPRAVAADAEGNIFIADTGNDRIRRVDGGGIISTIAGGGTSSADGIGPQSALLPGPAGIALGDGGAVFVSAGWRVRKIAGGIISTFAGNGNSCHSGDGGPAVGARMCTPRGIAIDAAGNMYIADHYGHRIVKVSAAGIVTTLIAGGYYTPGLGDGGPALAATIQYPYGLAIDPGGNLLIADMGDDRIRRVDLHAEPPTISTVAGGGTGVGLGDGGPATTARLSWPYDVTTDAAGNIFIADQSNNRVRRVDALTGTITTVAGNGESTIDGDGGPATAAGVDEPTDVTVDAAGNLYIGEAWRNVVRRVDPSGTITRFAGDGYYAGAGGRYTGDGIPATAASLNFPIDVVAGPDGNVYIADASNARVRRVNTLGIIETVTGTGSCHYFGDGGPASGAGICSPEDLAFDAAGNLYVTDYGDALVRKIQAPF